MINIYNSRLRIQLLCNIEFLDTKKQHPGTGTWKKIRINLWKKQTRLHLKMEFVFVFGSFHSDKLNGVGSVLWIHHHQQHVVVEIYVYIDIAMWEPPWAWALVFNHIICVRVFALRLFSSFWGRFRPPTSTFHQIPMLNAQIWLWYFGRRTQTRFADWSSIGTKSNNNNVKYA